MNITKIPVDSGEIILLRKVFCHMVLYLTILRAKKIPSNKGNFREVKSGYFGRIAQKTIGNFRIKKENTIVQSSNRRDNVKTSKYAWIDKNCER